jgi:hypothetical protein
MTVVRDARKRGGGCSGSLGGLIALITPPPAPRWLGVGGMVMGWLAGFWVHPKIHA